MDESNFPYDSDLLKHYVRTKAWLPVCKKRLATIKAESKKPRRIRYFTFCAVGAVDVLMLDVANIVVRSSTGRFDTVVFFDKDDETVSETKRRIPGAIGFTGNFTEIVLLADKSEPNFVDATDPLLAPATEPDNSATRRQQKALAMRHEFIQQFPFDIINLDLQDFTFKPGDDFPGKVVNALRKMFEWQCRKARHATNEIEVNEFTLMFTTRIGPSQMGKEYQQMLIDYLNENIQRDSALLDALQQRTGLQDIESLYKQDFAEFFKLAMPKALLSILIEEDWYVDPIDGISIYEFDRPNKSGGYTMLHLVMDVRRQVPMKSKRAPNKRSADAQAAYGTVAQTIFTRNVTVVSKEAVAAEKPALEKSLGLIQSRRKKYLNSAS